CGAAFRPTKPRTTTRSTSSRWRHELPPRGSRRTHTRRAAGACPWLSAPGHLVGRPRPPPSAPRGRAKPSSGHHAGRRDPGTTTACSAAC
ncbi:MAG: hypothetical protein AVDCRST_MAG67-1796, partial [uncultured Solirubrobacteraceae bacterium]